MHVLLHPSIICIYELQCVTAADCSGQYVNAIVSSTALKFQTTTDARLQVRTKVCLNGVGSLFDVAEVYTTIVLPAYLFVVRSRFIVEYRDRQEEAIND